MNKKEREYTIKTLTQFVLRYNIGIRNENSQKHFLYLSERIVKYEEKKSQENNVNLIILCVSAPNNFLWVCVKMAKSGPTLVAFVFEGILLVAGKPFRWMMYPFVCKIRL